MNAMMLALTFVVRAIGFLMEPRKRSATAGLDKVFNNGINLPNSRRMRRGSWDGKDNNGMVAMLATVPFLLAMSSAAVSSGGSSSMVTPAVKGLRNTLMDDKIEKDLMSVCEAHTKGGLRVLELALNGEGKSYETKLASQVACSICKRRGSTPRQVADLLSTWMSKELSRDNNTEPTEGRELMSARYDEITRLGLTIRTGTLGKEVIVERKPGFQQALHAARNIREAITVLAEQIMLDYKWDTKTYLSPVLQMELKARNSKTGFIQVRYANAPAGLKLDSEDPKQVELHEQVYRLYCAEIERLAESAAIVSNSDRGIQLTWFFEDGELLDVDFLDLEYITVLQGQKTMKRMGVFSSQSYLWSELPRFSQENILVLDDDNMPAGLTNKEERQLGMHDGRGFMSEALYSEIFQMSQWRLEGNPDAESIMRKQVNRNHIIRGFVAGVELIKGSVLVIPDARMEELFGSGVDLALTGDNIKAEIVTKDDMPSMIYLVPMGNNKSVRLSPSDVNHSWDSLINVTAPGDDETMLFKSLREDFENYKSRFHAGWPMHLDVDVSDDDDDDRVKQVKRRQLQVLRALGSLHESHSESRMLVQDYKNMLEMPPRKGYKKVIKRYRLPYAASFVLRNKDDYFAMYGEEAPNGPDEILFTEWGIILPDVITVNGELVNCSTDLIMRVLGGADWDDKVNAHIRKAVNDNPYFSAVKAGDMSITLMRHPIGTASVIDGPYEGHYVEQVTLKVAPISKRDFLKSAGVKNVNQLPEVDFSLMHRSLMELFPGIDDGTVSPRWAPLPVDTSKPLTVQTIMNIVDLQFRNPGFYGSHVVNRSAASRLRIPLSYGNEESEYVDVNQAPTADNIESMVEDNEVDKEVLYAAGLSGEFLFDDLEARSLNFESDDDYPTDKDGPFCVLWDNYELELEEFSKFMIEEITEFDAAREARAEMMVPFSELKIKQQGTHQIGFDHKDLPYALYVLYRDRRVIDRTSSKDGLDGVTYNNMLDELTANKLVSSMNSRGKHSEAMELLFQAFVWQHLASRDGDGMENRDRDRLLLRGGLLDITLQAVREYGMDVHNWISVHGDDAPDMDQVAARLEREIP